MVERKPFKTKLCVLYQKGHCPRQSCSFAHGNAELRQYLASYNGRQDYRSGDLRDKLDRRLSPRPRYSPGRNARGRNTFRGSGPSRSVEKYSDRKRRKKQHFDGQSDYSGSLKGSDGAENQAKRRKSTSIDSRIVLKEQLIQVQSEINMLEQRKSQLRTVVDEKVEEADILTSRIRELDSQLSKEKEESKRSISKIKKFVKAHKRYMRVQEELKRSQVRLEKLGDQIGSGTVTTGGNEEDSSINILSDGEAPDCHAISLPNEVQNFSSPDKKGLHVKCDTAEELIKANLNGGGYHARTIGLEKLSQLSSHPAQLNLNKEVELEDNRDDSHQPRGNESKQKRGKSISASIFAEKQKSSGLGLLAPSTSMAAHAIDELVDIEPEENIEVVENASAEIDKGATTYGARRLPVLLPPPPPPPPAVPRSTYPQYYQGKDENVDVEEMVDVDIV